MCGIAGLYHFKNSKTVREDDLVRMRDTLVHRGPDDAGAYFSQDKKVGLGTRRLKIIDLSPAGHMPMTTACGGTWITFNGEIYNFMELRRELEEKGHAFKSRSDTEVILNMYEEYGPEFVGRLNGMFAFVIWDERKKVLLAARDHMGIKPFYYAIVDGTFYFGSEIKAILAHPDFKKELDEPNVSHYLTFSSLPSPLTLFRNVRKLPPAHLLSIDAGGAISEREYWNPARAKGAEGRGEEFYVSEIRRLLRDSIKLQMVSDVPFGCFLSGGIDSSTNATLMSEALGKPVETFSVGSKEFAKYNEFQYSRLIAERIGTKPHEILTTEAHMREFLPKFSHYFDDPNGDQVCFPLYWLSKLTRDAGVIVIQIGEGSDELFTGYDTYVKAVRLYESWWHWLEKTPGFARHGAWSAAKLLAHPKFDFYKEYFRRLKDHQEPYWGNAIAFSDFQKQKLLTPSYQERIRHASSYPYIERFYKELEGIDNKADFLKQLTYLEVKQRLPELLLARADRMTMAHSLEGRVPFLDTRLVELAFQIPADIKLKDNEPKYILKKAVEDIIPHEIIWRKKQGFGTSLSEWLKPESKMAPLFVDAILNSKLRERGILDYDYVNTLVHAHQERGVEHNFRIWNLVTLSLWYDEWFG